MTLPDLVNNLADGSGRPRPPQRNPKRQGVAIYKALRIGRWQPRCLTLSLVHFSMLSEQGLHPVLVIGLPAEAANHDAHAWVEVDGHDVGPPPGHRGEVELARYPPQAR